MILSSIFYLESMLKHIETLSLVDFTFGSVPSWDSGFFLVWLLWLVFSGIQKRKCQASMIRSQQRRGCKGKQHKSRRKWSKNGSNSYSCVVETDCFHSIACKEGHWRTQGHSTISNETSQNQNQKQGVEGIDESYFFCFGFFVLFGLSQSCHVPPWVVSVCL